jgi:signal transduction histidine kinase
MALENARLQAEVKAQLAQVRASRSRLVAAGDQARRRLERNLHDGAQQRLLTLGLILQMLQNEVDAATGEGVRRLTDEARAELRAAIEELRDLARGIHPAILTDQGLRPAVDDLALRCPVPVTVGGADPGRLPREVESTAYFVVSEALANVVKHAAAGHATVTLAAADRRLVITVSDDGRGGAEAAEGSGLSGLADRVASLDGRFAVTSDAAGTCVRAELPLIHR